MQISIAFIARIVATAGTAATAAAAWIRRRSLWRWLTSTPPPEDALDKARVLVAGPTGVGKTTLINKVVGAERGKVGEGRPQTPGIEWLGTQEFPVWFADTKGLEIVNGVAQVEDIVSKLASWDVKERPHCAWLCIQADSARIIDQADEPEQSKRPRGTEGELGRVLNRANIPVIVVITQAEGAGPLLEEMRTRCQSIFDFRHSIVEVCAEPRTKDGRILIPAHGLDSLRRRTIENLPPDLAKKVKHGWPTQPPSAQR